MMMRDLANRIRLWVLILLYACCVAHGWGQEEDEEEHFLPGLIGRYESADGSQCERLDRAIAFDWRDSAPDRRLAGGRFRVQWRGRLRSQANGSYRIHIYVSGRAQVSLGGRVVVDADFREPGWKSSAPLELSYDDHPLLVTFEQTSDAPRIALFWSGPQFSLEPVDGRQLVHERGASPDGAFDRGAQLVRALRCAACHDISGEQPPLAAPALEHLAGNVRREWLVNWLSASPAEPAQTGPGLARRMPHFSLTATESAAIAHWLLDQSQPAQPLPTQPPVVAKSAGQNKKKKNEPEPPARTPLELGRELFLTVGCLGCHSLGVASDQGPFAGGDLSAIAAKRPPEFFARWLQAPETVNRHHRMPVFDLTVAERQQLATFLQSLGQPQPAPAADPPGPEAGRLAVERHRCAACHAVPRGPGNASEETSRRTPLTAGSDWSQSCAGVGPRSGQPSFSLTEADRRAVHTYVSQARSKVESLPIVGEQLLQEHNCLACHQRDKSPGLAPQLIQLAAAHPDLAPGVPAMTPPPLNSVGDKLHDEVLRKAITRSGPPHRPYLQVRMPRFPLADEEVAALVAHFVAADRIPDGAPVQSDSATSVTDPTLLTAVGSRLVTPDGFGCTSCHQVGDVLPVQAPLNARGPTLSGLGQRVRREWYDRWVRNPARIVPRMEMPSVQVAVRGVLGDHLDTQLAAVWDVLNRPGFQPPEPSPVRVLRHTGTELDARALLVTDVVRAGSETLIKPVLLGLANRHNVLFDLQTARLASWSIGDTARQRTEGKSWYWESAGQEIHRPERSGGELSVWRSGTQLAPRVRGQFVTELDSWEFAGSGLQLRYRVFLNDSSRPLHVTQSVIPFVDAGRSGFRRTVLVTGLEPKDRLHLELIDDRQRGKTGVPADSRSVVLKEPAPIQISLPLASSAEWDATGVAAPAVDGRCEIELEYATTLPVDQFLVTAPPPAPLSAEPLNVVPGFTTTRLPLPVDIMPTALAWRPDGTLVMGSLKGQVWSVADSDGDGLGDRLTTLIDGLAAPYGLAASADYVDVANKYAVLRLYDDDGDGGADRAVTIASGWGHTVDYHDWVIGLPRDESGNYYLALPCQQDQRSEAAAVHRGEFLRLVPRQPTTEDPRLFSLEVISRGHRFPMGIARRRDGELFVTDNQGNYNPFNELNHVRAGAHFGFINALEKGSGVRTPLTPPAIDLPHPWVRSVNGICFLDTPAGLRAESGSPGFGPFEGDLIGCEMDTRRLIRMTLQTVGETIQGAAYPFSYDQPLRGPPLLGPLVCGVAPDGDVYVGGLRDSGWGGANNIGELVRLRFEPSQSPCGIAEMRAVPGGFELEFTAPVDRRLAADPARYSLASYTRESTPAYGGPDLLRRTEVIREVRVSPDGRRVVLHVGGFRPGFVYELHVQKLVSGAGEFFPAEAHYTLRVAPE